MELFSTGFLSALAAIVVIDLVLAGDNAIVIAMAARRVPKALQKRAIVWGTVGAIVVRSSLTVLVVGLLKIPGLLAIGGALLVWIAYKLLAPGEHHEQHPDEKSRTGFWQAMRTIVIADTIMGLDNVLAVAGAAHGSFLLVICGLLISIPIVVWGSTMILGFIERHPAFVYLGAGILAWTAAKMIHHEPMLQTLFRNHAWILPATYLGIIGGVLWAGLVRNHRHREARIRMKLAEFDGLKHERLAKPYNSPEGEAAMLKILVPVDNSPNSLLAVQQVVKDFFHNASMEVHLLHIRTKLPHHVTRFLPKNNLESFYREEAEKALRPARDMLMRHGIPFAEHVDRGPKAEVIVAAARRLHCDHIVMSTARAGSFTRMIESSVTGKVLELTDTPVEVVSGSSISRLEKFGVPAGLGAALALLLMALSD